jgi:predicted enzyme related to lactoylglutathione lyase
MTTRDHAPVGAPCWVDLWTSDIPGSRTFYGELFGWESGDPDPEFGGYFIFTRQGVDIAGCMGDMGEGMEANDTWKIYLATDDIIKTTEAAEAAGAQVIGPVMPVADLGVQSVLVDPTGAHLGAWQAGTFPGFTVLDEPGAPSWFELHTGQYAAALDFYRNVFHWETTTVGDSDEFRYSTLQDPGSDEPLAGIMDASAFLPEGTPPYWALYWEVADADAALATVQGLGGSVVQAAEDTPYGRIATVADPAGAVFRVRTGPS